MNALYWTSPDWVIFSRIPTYPYFLLSSLELKVSSKDGYSQYVSSFTANELYLWEMIVGKRTEKGCTFHLNFPWYAKTNVSLRLHPKKTALQELTKYYQEYVISYLDPYLPTDLTYLIADYLSYPLERAFPTVSGLGVTEETRFKHSILLPCGATQMRKNVSHDELNYIWHVSWAYVRKSDPYTILLPKENESKEAELSEGGEVKFLQKMNKGIYHALFVPQEELIRYQTSHHLHLVPGKKGVKKIHVRFEPDHFKDTQVIMIKHYVAHIVSAEYEFKIGISTSPEDHSSDDEE